MSTDIDLSGVSDGDIRVAAVAYAACKHWGQVYYGEGPFLLHPIDVGSVAEEFGLDSDAFIAACLLHDVVEDTDATVEDVRDLFGEEVAGLVDSVTDVEDKCPISGRDLPRMELRRRTRAKTKRNRRGVALKLCDRTANTRSGIAQLDTDPHTAWRYLNGYIGEYPEFRQDLYIEGEYDRLWEELDNLYDFLLDAQDAA